MLDFTDIFDDLMRLFSLEFFYREKIFLIEFDNNLCFIIYF